MSWDLHVVGGDPAFLASGREHALPPLDAAVVADAIGDEDAWPGDTLVAEVHVTRYPEGVVRAVSVSVRFDATETDDEADWQRSEYAALLDRVLTLADRLGAPVWDPQRETWLDRDTAAAVAAALPR